MVTRPDSQAFPPGGSRVHALVLAAGAGTRMGGGKLRREWRGRPLLLWALDAALAAPVAHVWLVTGSDKSLVEIVPADERLTLVSAKGWRDGLSASLQAGIAALPDGVGAALILLGDMPRLPLGVATALIEAWREGASAAAPVWGGRRGHPVLLDRSLFPAVAGLTGDRGAGSLLASLGDRLALVEAPDDGVLFDVDTLALLDG